MVCLSTAKWTGKGNLVLTAGHGVTQHQMKSTVSSLKEYLLSYAKELFNTKLSNLIAQPNIKWSRITINGIPTSKTKEEDTPYNPDQCHSTLMADNTVYASFRIMQKPSWICHPDIYNANTSSSLIMAFEDGDGSKAKELLAACQLYIFRAKAKVKKWKQSPPKLHTTPCPTATKLVPPEHTKVPVSGEPMLEDSRPQAPPSPAQLYK